MTLVAKGKDWLKSQDWKAFATSPVGLAIIGATLWSITHRSGVFSYMFETDEKEDGQKEQSASHLQWHLKYNPEGPQVIFVSLGYVHNETGMLKQVICPTG